jgi:hypothetical protein
VVRLTELPEEKLEFGVVGPLGTIRRSVVALSELKTRENVTDSLAIWRLQKKPHYYLIGM